MDTLSVASDERGLALTGANTDQATRFDAIVRDYLTYKATTSNSLAELCAEAPEFAMAQLLQGFLLLSAGASDAVSTTTIIAESLATMKEQLTRREQLHLSALNAWILGNTDSASRFWDEAMFSNPHDLIALKLQHSTLFWSGQTEHMRDSAARALAAWNDDIPGFAHVQAMMAFALEETGHYSSAERLGKEAFDRCPDDLWAIHAVSHVFEMQGRLNEGLDWLNFPDTQWEDRNPFRAHLWWHAALFAVEKGAFDKVLDLYDRAIDPDGSRFYLDTQNAASLLARLDFADVDTGNRWQQLANIAEESCEDHVWMFTEPHRTMSLAKTQRKDKLDHQLNSLHKLEKHKEHSGAPHVKPLVVPLCSAIADFYQEDYQSATDTLMDIRYDYQSLGGSHAQRDVFSIYLVDAASRLNNLDLARALLTERVTRHPNSYPSWKKYAEVCEKMGDDSAARHARNQVNRVAGLT